MNFKKRSLIIISFIAVISAIVLILIIIPAVKDIKRTNQEINNLRLDMERRYVKGRNLQKIISDLETIKAQMPELSKMFVEENKELELINFLEKTAKTWKVQQTINLDQSQKSLKQNINTFPIKLSLKGNFLDITRYLNDLEKADYYLNVQALTTNLLTDKQDIMDQTNTTLTGEIFWQAQ